MQSEKQQKGMHSRQMEICKENLNHPFYNETEDQLRSITEIKKDMERERPMDRLALW